MNGGGRQSKNTWLSIQLVRVALIIAVSAIAASFHLLFYGYFVAARLPISPRSLQSSLATVSFILFLTGSFIMFILPYVLSSSTLTTLETLLPCGKRRYKLVRDKVRYDGDGGGSTLGSSNSTSSTNNVDHETEIELFYDINKPFLWLGHVPLEAHTNDHVYTIYLTILWHIVMATPIATLVFETGWSPEAQFLYGIISGIVGIVLIILSVRSLYLHGLTVVPFASLIRTNTSVMDSTNGSMVSSSSTDLRQRHTTNSDNNSIRTTKSVIPALLALKKRNEGGSSFPLISWSLYYHSLASLFFLWLHIDRGGQIHFHPYS